MAETQQILSEPVQGAPKRDTSAFVEGARKRKENREKVLLEFDKYNPSDTTPAGLEARMTAAVALSGVTVEVGPSNMDMAGGQGGQRGTGGNQGGPVKVPDNAVKIGTALGVKPEELQALADKKAGKTT